VARAHWQTDSMRLLRRKPAPYLYQQSNGTWKRHLPLPLKTRLRLRATRRVDITAAWLIEHGLETVAVGLWRACRLR
jgi:hypothetical protein